MKMGFNQNLASNNDFDTNTSVCFGSYHVNNGPVKSVVFEQYV